MFNKCYVNKYNLYNQVGMIAINCMGEMYGAEPPKRASTLLDLNQSMQGPNLEDELNIDKSTL